AAARGGRVRGAPDPRARDARETEGGDRKLRAALTRLSAIVPLRSRRSGHQRRIQIRPPIAKESEGRARARQGAQVEGGQGDALFLATEAGHQFAAVVGDEGTPVETLTV